MPAADRPDHTFRAALHRFPGAGAPHYLPVPTAVAEALGGTQGTRLRVGVDGRFSDHLALRRRGDVYFVSAGEAMRRRCRLSLGSEAKVTLSPDDSRHGIPLPKVMREVFRYEPEAAAAFAKLSPGKRRTHITRVRKTRTREGRIRVALALVDELRGRERGATRWA